MEKILFTSESVTEGHPDKIADSISDAILDAILKQDKYARVACETLISTNFVVIAGEITTTAEISIADIVKKRITDIGYKKDNFDLEAVEIIVKIDKQSSDIAQGVNENDGEHLEQGAGDQGIMFGYATDETPEYMPITAVLAHKLAKQLTKVRKDGTLKYLRPDGKTQVTVQFDSNDIPVKIDTIILSNQHTDTVSHEQIVKDLTREVIEVVCPKKLVKEDTKIFINPTGKFVIGGPEGDAGLTGRKIIIDTYGGVSRHGGGAFSGKDPSKVDRSAAYAARYIAKNIVASGLAKRCEIQLSYAIGMANPISIAIETFNTNKIVNESIIKAIRENFDLRPKSIIRDLDLLRPIYTPTSTYGHFGRTDIDLPWEKLDKVELLKKYLK